MAVVAIAPGIAAALGHTLAQIAVWAMMALLILFAHRRNILTALQRSSGGRGAS
jgi:hypothetical protein